jgi:ubiquitin C-terminal hydrolase
MVVMERMMRKITKPETENNMEQKMKYPLHCAVANLFQSLQDNNNNNDNDNENNNSFNKYNRETTKRLGELKAIIDKQTYQFIGYDQQDSHEFLSTLLDLLHDEIVNYEKKQKEEMEKKEKENRSRIIFAEGKKDDTKSITVTATETETETTIATDVEKDGYVIVNTLQQPTTATTTTTTTTTIDENDDNNNGDNDASASASTCTTITSDLHSNKKARLTKGTKAIDEEDVEFDIIEEEISSNSSTSTTSESTLDEMNKIQNDEVNGNEDEHQNIDEDMKEMITKVPTFSQLKLEEISDLLHGKSEEQSVNDEQLSSTVSASSSSLQVAPTKITSHDHDKKLIGGRVSYDTVSDATSSHFELKTATEDTVTSNNNLEDVDVCNQNHQQQEGCSSNDMDIDIQENTNDQSSSQQRQQSQHHELESTTTASTSNDEAVSYCASINAGTLVDTFFTMEIRTCLTCDSCNFARSHQETFRHLSIEVGDLNDADDVDSSNNVATQSSISSPISSILQQHYERNIQEGLRKFFSKEKLELKCEKCFGESATQSKEIVRLPKVLLLHLKRFIVDVSPDYSRISYRKNQSAVEFGECLTMDAEDNENGALGEFLGTDVSYPKVVDENETDDCGCKSCSGKESIDGSEDDDYEILQSTDRDEEDGQDDDFVDLGIMKRKYKVRSVVNHIGSSASCGHYTANASKLKNKEGEEKECCGKQREWFRFNDDFVSKLSNEEAMGERTQKNAYLIMYEFE